MSRLTFYRYAVPMNLRNWWLRAQVLAISAFRVVKGMLLGRWPWETVREIREEHRRICAAFEPLWADTEKRVLPGGDADRPRRREGEVMARTRIAPTLQELSAAESAEAHAKAMETEIRQMLVDETPKQHDCQQWMEEALGCSICHSSGLLTAAEIRDLQEYMNGTIVSERSRAEAAESSERRLRERVEAKAKEWERHADRLPWGDKADALMTCAREVRTLTSGSQSSRGDAKETGRG